MHQGGKRYMEQRQVLAARVLAARRHPEPWDPDHRVMDEGDGLGPQRGLALRTIAYAAPPRTLTTGRSKSSCRPIPAIHRRAFRPASFYSAIEK